MQAKFWEQFWVLKIFTRIYLRFFFQKILEVGHQTQELPTLLLLCKLVRLILTLIMFSSLLKLTPLSHSPTLLRCKISSKQLSLLDLSQLFSATRETHQILIHLIVWWSTPQESPTPALKLISPITSKERALQQKLRLTLFPELQEDKMQESLFEYDEILLDRFILLYFSYHFIQKSINKSHFCLI